MSVWSSLEGTIKIPKGVSCSVRECIKEVFDDYRNPFITQTESDGCYKTFLVLEFLEDGQKAVDLAVSLIELIKHLTKEFKLIYHSLHDYFKEKL